MAKIKIPAMNTPMGMVLIFILLGFCFATFRGYVSYADRALLYSSGEVEAWKPKDPRASELEQIIKQSKEVSKIITGKAPASVKKGSSSTARQQTYHVGRKEPPKDGFYLESNEAEDEDVPQDILMYITAQKQAVYHPELWDGQQDCAAVGWIRITDDGILVTVEVTDDELKADAARPWECDAVELYFDFRPPASRGKEPYEKGVFQAIALPCFAKTGADKVSFYASGGKVIPVPGARMKSFVRPNGKGYTLKVFLPFAGIRASHYLPTKDFSFDFAIDDSDTGGRSQLIWSGTVDNCRSPKFFGHMKPYLQKR
ncbi:MAG: hypothetical protein A2020_12705 [Lentisphaerae bacterium GWF2_45_14]|nr:MAG: hypothetical protein A2020_12705 [Lentisphaerae bacterium GWF2_45_14]